MDTNYTKNMAYPRTWEARPKTLLHEPEQFPDHSNGDFFEGTTIQLSDAEKIEMLNWILSHFHLIDVTVRATFCDDRDVPAVGFGHIDVVRPGRPWNMRGGHREGLVEAIRKEMEKSRA